MNQMLVAPLSALEESFAHNLAGIQVTRKRAIVSDDHSNTISSTSFMNLLCLSVEMRALSPCRRQGERSY